MTPPDYLGVFAQSTGLLSFSRLQPINRLFQQTVKILALVIKLFSSPSDGSEFKNPKSDFQALNRKEDGYRYIRTSSIRTRPACLPACPPCSLPFS